MISYEQIVKDVRLPSADFTYVTLGLVGEVGELLGAMAKSLRDNTPPDAEHYAKELGDILWFVTALSHDLGYSLEDIAKMNAEKLLSRKERGKIQGSGDNR